MSLNKFIGVEIKIDNTIPSILIHVLGGHSSGKSGVVGRIKQKYGNKITALGKYSESKTAHGLLTGGMDGVKMTQVERFDNIKKNFFSNKQVVLCEGFMITYYGSFSSRYYDLQKIKNRVIHIILLQTDLDVMCERIFKRSKGKELSEKRLRHLKQKANTSQTTYDKLVENDIFIKTKFNTSDPKVFDEVVEYMSKIIDGVLLKQ